MSQKRVFQILLTLVLTSLTCNMPFNTTAEPSQAEIDQLNSMISADMEFGGMSEADIDVDGVVDNIYYTFPTYELHPGVFVTKTYTLESGEGSTFFPGIVVAIKNESGVEQAFQFVLKVPKEFASDVSQLTFSLEPAEIIEPDPVLNFNLAIPPEQQVEHWLTIYSNMGLPEADLLYTKQVLMETAFGEVEDKCKNAYFPMKYQQDACYMNMVVDFKNFIPKDYLESYCDLVGEKKVTSCQAIVNKDISKCLTGKDKSKQENCKGIFINDLCKAEKTEEDRIICLGREAVQNKSADACFLLPDLDMKNYCLANVYSKTSYCDSIQNEEIKSACVAALGTTSSFPFGDSGKPIKKFDYRNAKKYCARFAALTSAFPYVTTPKIVVENTLTCSFSVKENDSSYNVQVFIKLYNTAAEAQKEWKELHPVGDLELGISRSLLVLENKTATSYFYIQKFDYSDDTSSYQLDAGELMGRGCIYYQQQDMQSGDSAYWVATRAQAKQLIGE